LLVLKSSPFHKASDLNGKTIGVVVLLNSAHVATRAWLDKHGGDSSTVKFIEMPYPVMLPALRAHRIDAAAISEPFMHEALPESRSIGAPYDGVASRFLMGGMFARADYAKANPELMRKLNEIISEAGEWANTHPVESGELMKKYLKADVPAGTIRFLFSPDKSAALLQPLIDVSAKYGALKADTPASDIIFTPPSH
jgi:NitT/TauT family transport system substrate-binding protein